MIVDGDLRRLLRRFAQKYIWWQTPERSLERPLRVVSQVMNLGTFEDASQLLKSVGRDSLVEALRTADPGVYSPRSWAYWHYRLGLSAPAGPVPAVPKRRPL